MNSLLYIGYYNIALLSFFKKNITSLSFLLLSLYLNYLSNIKLKKLVSILKGFKKSGIYSTKSLNIFSYSLLNTS